MGSCRKYRQGAYRRKSLTNWVSTTAMKCPNFCVVRVMKNEKCSMNKIRGEKRAR